MRYVLLGLLGALAFGVWGCGMGDPAQDFVARVDAMPPEKRPPNWEQTRALMQRRCPAPGEAAPDFALQTYDGTSTVRLSEYHPDRPRVLIFASYT